MTFRFDKSRDFNQSSQCLRTISIDINDNRNDKKRKIYLYSLISKIHNLKYNISRHNIADTTDRSDIK